MLRAYWGSIGHVSVVIAFIAAIFSTICYFLSSRAKSEQDHAFWRKWASGTFIVHGIGIFSVIWALFTIIHKKYFEYHYAWDNTSLSLPFGYAISCFWQDQEGSFLLWMFWNVILGFILMLWFRKKKEMGIQGLESPMMVTFAAVQAFLTSMILGAVIWGDFKIGSNPFLSLKESMPNLPVWKSQPDFVPKDGKGLNPLLQNYWMVIHPPTLFLGFAMTLVPFSFAIGALWKRRFTEWIKMALPWTLLSAMVLGVGIMMGAKWAYETLSFGGYWSWDPVENAVYVPWLVLVASFHVMLIARKSSSALKASFILAVVQFILILYSTFLTRSGILGNASVHSFTDLGLSGQLLVYLLFFVFGAILLMAIRWKELPRDEKEATLYSTETWVFAGVIFLSLAAFQVIMTTSIPVYNTVSKLLGKPLNWSTPAEPNLHYTTFQMWLFAAITTLTGIAQFFWWKKISKGKLNTLINIGLGTLLISAVIIMLTKVNDWKYILILTASFFGFIANAYILLETFKKNFKVAGGAITHMGLALMLIGILYSSAYEKVISLNVDNQKIFEGEKDNRDNVLLNLNNPKAMNGFDLKYEGEFVDIRNMPGYQEKRVVKSLNDAEGKATLRTDIMDGDKKIASRGDTIVYEGENTYYKINYTSKDGADFNLYPRFQINPEMGNVASPDIRSFWNKDIYAHVSYVTTDQDKEWTLPENFTAGIGDTLFLNDYVAILDDVRTQNEVEGMPLKNGEVGVRSTLRILTRDGERFMYPLFAIKDGQVWSIPVVNNELGVRAQLVKIDPETGKFTFTISRGEKEFVVVKAIEKPFINLLWIGTIMVMIGATIASIRRFKIDLV
ncbi:MAG: cytochrome c biogenesis protein CcsA [Leadbetterella sp.]